MAQLNIQISHKFIQKYDMAMGSSRNIHQRKMYSEVRKMSEISWNDFQKVELRVGTIMAAWDFPEARNPAYILEVDFGS